MKLRDYFTERRIIREDRRRLRRLFSLIPDLEFSRIFDDTWYSRHKMTKAGWKRK